MCGLQVQGFSILTPVWGSAPSRPGQNNSYSFKTRPSCNPLKFFPLPASDGQFSGTFWRVDHKYCGARLSKAVDKFLPLRTHKGVIGRTDRNSSGSRSYDTECHSPEGASKIKGENRVSNLWFCNLILRALSGLGHLSIHPCCWILVPAPRTQGGVRGRARRPPGTRWTPGGAHGLVSALMRRLAARGAAGDAREVAAPGADIWDCAQGWSRSSWR